MRSQARQSLVIVSLSDRRATRSTRSMPTSGRLDWRFRFGGDVVGIAATSDLVFVVSLDNLVRALNRSNGNQIWKQSTARPAQLPRLRCSTASSRWLAPTRWRHSTAGPASPIGTFDAPESAPRDSRSWMRRRRPSPCRSWRSRATAGRSDCGPSDMMFREKAVEPLAALPGRALLKEASPLP